MNSKQAKIAGVTAVSTLSAEVLIGGLGVGLLGTAVAVPASLVVATVGSIAFLAAGDANTTDTPSDSTPYTKFETKRFYLSKEHVTYKFSINSKGWAQSCQKQPGNTFGKYVFYKTIDDCRDFYKSLLQQGFKPA